MGKLEKKKKEIVIEKRLGCTCASNEEGIVFSIWMFPKNSTMMSPWTCCELNTVNYHYCLIPPPFPTAPSCFTAPPLGLPPLCPHLGLGLPLFLPSPCDVVWLHFSFQHKLCVLPSLPPDPPHPQTHKLLTAIWKVSAITRTVLIRTSWHILAKTCTYGNSIRKRGERGGEKKCKGAQRG